MTAQSMGSGGSKKEWYGVLDKEKLQFKPSVI